MEDVGDTLANIDFRILTQRFADLIEFETRYAVLQSIASPRSDVGDHRVLSELIRLDHKLTGFEQLADQGAELQFANGASVIADAVVAADGVHSFVKASCLGTTSRTSQDASPIAPCFPHRF